MDTKKRNSKKLKPLIGTHYCIRIAKGEEELFDWLRMNGGSTFMKAICKAEYEKRKEEGSL